MSTVSSQTIQLSSKKEREKKKRKIISSSSEETESNFFNNQANSVEHSYVRDLLSTGKRTREPSLSSWKNQVWRNPGSARCKQLPCRKSLIGTMSARADRGSGAELIAGQLVLLGASLAEFEEASSLSSTAISRGVAQFAKLGNLDQTL